MKTRRVNRQWRLAAYPEGMPKVSDWVMVEQAAPQAGRGELLVRALVLDVAPSQRGRISRRDNYSSGVKPGDVMVGCAVGEVLASRAEGYLPGDIVVTDTSFGWQELSAISANAVRKIDLALAPPACWLDFLGFNGATAYIGIKLVADVQAGDNVVVSAAAGSVGQIAGQVARICGARPIAITSGAEKVAHCLTLGYDAAVDYTAEIDLAETIVKLCPEGVNVFFDNTAGPIHDAVMQNLATHARIALCGTVSLAARFDEVDLGQRFLREILVARARLQGFLVVDYAHVFDQAWRELLSWYQSGQLNCRYDTLKGIENVPEAFLRLLTSKNIGKQVVDVT